jgi:hypothetical protein
MADGCERSYGDAAADLVLRGDHSLEVPVTCDGGITYGCHGGVPQDLPPVIFAFATTPTVVTYAAGASRFDMSSTFALRTTDPIPYTWFGADCFLGIDTAPGARRDVTVDVPLKISTDATGAYDLAFGDVVLTGISEDDIDIIGGLACQLANLREDFWGGVIVDQLKGNLLQPICTAPDPDLVVYCDS